MPVPALITELSTTASSNSPAGSETPTDGDNYLRAHAAFIAQLNANKLDKTGSVTPTANQPMGGYKHTGAGVGSASGEYLVYGSSVNLPSGANFGYAASTDTSTVGGVVTPNYGINFGATYSGAAGSCVALSGYYGILFVTDGTERSRYDRNGNLLYLLPATPPTLSTNGQVVLNLTSNTNLRISARGDDGVTRVANITLA